jgi:GT2 family glycosyltransferase
VVVEVFIVRWKIVAVIPNWNGAGRLERCLKSLEEQNRRFDQVIVVDNGSTDGSARLAQIRLDRNYGFAVAVNRGTSAATGADWIAILNNDVVLHPAWLEMLLDSPAEYALLTGRTLQMHRPDLLDGGGDALSMGLAAARLGHGAPDGEPYDVARPVSGVCFAAALIRADVFRQVGLLEERFFAYLEDAEFCLRARLAGFRAWYEPMAVAWHEGSASSGGGLSPNVVQWMTAHQLLLAARYASGEMWSRVATVQTLWAARMLLNGRCGPWSRGIADALRQWTAMRDAFPVDRVQAATLLLESEKLIRVDHCAKDLFWRIYFGS